MDGPDRPGHDELGLWMQGKTVIITGATSGIGEGERDQRKVQWTFRPANAMKVAEVSTHAR
jgi:NADP-dependent 3-hydroxy acid dehydrogenase YdfG